MEALARPSSIARSLWPRIYQLPSFLRAGGINRPLVGDVAELEWAVNGGVRAADVSPLDVAELGAIAAEQSAGNLLSIPILQFRSPSNIPLPAYRRAVINSDDDALGKIDLGCGPRHLLVERGSTGR